MPRLYLLSGPDVGKSFDVVHGATFGRSAECTVHLRDVSVSRLHAHLELSGDRWTIVDAKSRNGLTVGGERVERALLADGDEFTLGEVLLRFRADGVAATPGSGAPASGGAAALRPGPAPGVALAPGVASAPGVAPAPGVARASGVELASRGAPTAPDVVPIASASAVPQVAPAPSVSPVASRAPSSEEDSIELEGDWSGAAETFSVARPLAETAVRPAPTRSPESMPNAPRTASTRQTAGDSQGTSAAPIAPTLGVAPASRAAPGAEPASRAAIVDAHSARTSSRAPSTVDRSRPVLQYQRVAQRDGVFNAELSQLPVWARFGLYGLAALVAAALFFVAFKGTLFLKERAPGSDSELPGTGE